MFERRSVGTIGKSQGRFLIAVALYFVSVPVAWASWISPTQFQYLPYYFLGWTVLGSEAPSYITLIVRSCHCETDIDLKLNRI